jgi:hypothetical protein
VLGGTEIQDILEYADKSRQHRFEIASAVRQKCSRLYEESGIISHALTKPHGYAGDYEILEYIYDQTPHKSTKSEIGETIDKWALNLSLPRAVRGRKNALYFWLFECGYSARGKLDVLSIGSGSARELRELPSTILEKMNITLIDRDQRSLAFAEQGLLEKVPDLKISLINELFNRVKPNQKYDIIYSFGVFDYLADRIITNCFDQYTPFLKDNGCFVYSIKNSRQYQDWFYDIFTDWRFVTRSIEDGANLAVKSGLRVKDTCRLESDVAAVYVCSKP